MIKTKEQELKEVEQWEGFLKEYKEKEMLNKEDLKQLQLFNYNTTTIYFQIFPQGYEETEQQKRFFELEDDIKEFYNSIKEQYDLPSIKQLFGIQKEHSMRTSVMTFEGISSKNCNPVTITNYHKNDFIHN